MIFNIVMIQPNVILDVICVYVLHICHLKRALLNKIQFTIEIINELLVLHLQDSKMGRHCFFTEVKHVRACLKMEYL